MQAVNDIVNRLSSSTGQRFQLLQGKHISAAQEEARDLGAEFAIEGGIGLGQGRRGGALDVAHQGGEFSPALLVQADVNLRLIRKQGAGDQFPFADIHLQAHNTSR